MAIFNPTSNDVLRHLRIQLTGDGEFIQLVQSTSAFFLYVGTYLGVLPGRRKMFHEQRLEVL